MSLQQGNDNSIEGKLNVRTGSVWNAGHMDRGIPKRTYKCPTKFNNTFRGGDSVLQERRKHLGNVEAHDEEV